jgi:hypothetical protein
LKSCLAPDAPFVANNDLQHSTPSPSVSSRSSSSSAPSVRTSSSSSSLSPLQSALVSHLVASSTSRQAA